MTTRVLSLSDSHFERRSPRWSECLRIHEWICCLAEAERPDLIVHPGDVFDGGSTEEERLAVEACFIRLANVCPVAVAKGNHDAKGELPSLSNLGARHPIIVVEDARTLVFGGLAVSLVAWPSLAGVIDRGVARDALRAVFQGLSLEHPEAAHRLLVGHFDIAGARVGKGQPLTGGALTVGLDDLALAGAHAVVAGHIHAAQTWHHAGVPMGYVGSSFRTDFGESEEKSVSLLTFESGQPVRWDRIATPARAMHLFEGEFRPLEGICFTTPPETRAAVRGADIRLRYRVAPEHREEARKHAASIEAKWLADGAATVKLDPETIATTRARTPEIAAARTLVEKVELRWKSVGDVPPPPVAERLRSKIHQLEEVTP